MLSISSTNNEENIMLDSSDTTENDQLLPGVALVKHKGKKVRNIVYTHPMA
jgi:hypothetical protein